MEIWKDVVGYEDDYQVSNIGRVRSKFITKLKGRSNVVKEELIRIKKLYWCKGYWMTSLYKNKKPFHATIHRLVAAAFLPNPHNYGYVNHKDLNKENNHIDNLEWCTRSQNSRHAMKHGVFPMGEKHGQVKITEEIVKDIRKRHSEGEKSVDLSRIYGVTQQTICDITKRRSWKHI